MILRPENFDMNYLNKLPWEIIEIIWYYLPIETKIRCRKVYYERYHYIILSKIRRFDDYMVYIISKKYKFLFKLVLDECYLKLINNNYCDSTLMYDSYTTKLLVLCDT